MINNSFVEQTSQTLIMLLRRSIFLCSISLVLEVFAIEGYSGGNNPIDHIYKYGLKTGITCKDMPCSENADCKTEGSGYVCTCKEGYFGLGQTCYMTPCYSSPCQNGGTCLYISGEETFKCACPIGFAGDTCDQTVYPCGKVLHGGHCKHGVQDGSETSGEDASSNVCETETGKGEKDTKCGKGKDTKTYEDPACCSKDTCKNDGKCVQIKDPDGLIYCSCTCLPGFSSEFCEITTLTCEPVSPCQNGGTCISENNLFKNCTCLSGYTGILCQEREYQSYLNFPRIHFSGKFQADTPTVNNILENYDTLNFSPVDAEQGKRGKWNPLGSGDFRFVDTHVTRVCYEDGYCSYQKHEDPMIQAIVKDGSLKAAAKLVDIDHDVQGKVCEIWGFTLEVNGFFKGDLDLSSVRYLWHKMAGIPPDFGDGARYQSVLTNVQFGPDSIVKQSKIAQYLKDAIGVEQKLSISFNMDMMSEDIKKDNYSYGRLVGSIGISGKSSPPYFTHGRMLKPLPGFLDFSFAPFVFETVGAKKQHLFIDLGNSLAIDRNGKIKELIGKLSIGINKDKDINHPTCLNNIQVINDVHYGDYGGYNFTSGIIVIEIPTEFHSMIENSQVILAQTEEGTRKCLDVVLAEDKDGIDINPLSLRLFRTEPERQVTADLLATVFGKTPKDTDIIDVTINYAESIVGKRHPKLKIDPVTKLENGIFRVTIMPQNPDNVRKFVDGQMYALEYIYNNNPPVTDRLTAMNSALFVLVWNSFSIPDEPNWLNHIFPIFQQYANLYPVMKVNFMDLGNYYDVVENKRHIMKTMMLDKDDPNYMPVTRDLSPQKSKMIVKWLSEEKPYLGIAHIGLDEDILKLLLQIALQLEHATIPIYLNGFLSIKPGQNQEVKDILHNILIDEMFHLAQVSNTLNAIGGNPNLLGDDFIPSYPSYLPGGVQPDLKVTIDKVSIRQIQDVYMEIEKPFHELEEHGVLEIINRLEQLIYARSTEPLSASSQTAEIDDDCLTILQSLLLRSSPENDVNTNHNTIGELYMAVIFVLAKLTNCGRDNSIFTPARKQLEFGPLVKVIDFETALKGIQMIVEQGEGASPCNPLQSNDSKTISHYFHFSSIVHKRAVKAFTSEEKENMRARQHDPIYGPRILTFLEQEKNCKGSYSYTGNDIPFYDGGVWPVVNDPKMSKYRVGSKAYTVAKTFNEEYSKLLHALQTVFDGNVNRFGDVMGLMKTLIVYGNRVVSTPIEDNGDPVIGPNAGPTYLMD